MDEGSHSSLALAAVTFVLRHQPFAGLHQFEEVISNLLGPDPNLTLAEASAFGSFKLLYWLASVSPKSRHDRTPGWKLANYMMSEPVYNLWQFRKLIEAATERNDVEIVEFAFNHFVTGSVTVETVELAAEMGHLEVLQTFLEHDMGEYCTHHYHYCGTTHGHCPLRESVPDITDEQAKKGNWVHWGGKSILNAVENGHYDVALWLHECAPYTSNEEELEMIVCHALSAGETELAEEFLPPRKSLLDYAQYCPRLDEIEKVLAKGILKDNQQAAAKAIVELARTGRLDLIKQVAEHYDHPLEHRGFYWGEYWCEAIIEACSVGDLPMTKWLVGHQKGRAICSRIMNDPQTTHFLPFAAEGGSVDVVQYLYDQHYADQYIAALGPATCGGHLDVFKWLVEHLPRADRGAASFLVVEAAKHGNLDFLQYLHELDSSASPGRFTWMSISQRKRALKTNAWWATAAHNTMNWAASNGHLNVVEWLHRNRQEGCTSDAMDQAATKGHLDVVKWLQGNRPEGCTTAAMDGAAANGHNDVVKWLHENTSAGCTTNAMDLAAGNGHLAIVKWLHANRGEGCTDQAITAAVEHSHVRVARWLQKHYPDRALAKKRMEISGPDAFEMVLFLHSEHVYVFGATRVRYVAKRPRISVGPGPNADLVTRWLRGTAARSC